jgi:hypothetical protein
MGVPVASDSKLPFSDDIEAVRQLLLFARRGSELGLSRREIVDAAEIRATDLDNFTTTDPKTGRFKTIKPPARVLSRLMQYVATSERLRRTIAGSKELEGLLQRVTQTYQSLKAFGADDDYFFLHLNKINAMDSKKCQSICKALAGNYYAYRFARRKNMVVRSYFEIQKYDPTRKLPSFKHYLKYEEGIKRLTRGQIMEIGTNYVFTGFVESGTYDFEGVKFIVAPKGTFGHSNTLSGLFISCAGKTEHQMGYIQLTRTSDQYDEEMLRVLSIDEMGAHDPLFDVKRFRKDVSSLLDDGFLVAALRSELN